MLQTLTDTEFLAALEACTLPAEYWTHEAHLRMAWLVAQREATVDGAIDFARRGIKAYNAARGGPPSKYHETVTAAYMRLIWDRIHSHGPSASFDAFRLAHPGLFTKYPGPLLDHYTREMLDSPEARERFVEPGLAPLP